MLNLEKQLILWKFHFFWNTWVKMLSHKKKVSSQTRRLRPDTPKTWLLQTNEPFSPTDLLRLILPTTKQIPKKFQRVNLPQKAFLGNQRAKALFLLDRVGKRRAGVGLIQVEVLFLQF